MDKKVLYHSAQEVWQRAQDGYHVPAISHQR